MRAFYVLKPVENLCLNLLPTFQTWMSLTDFAKKNLKNMQESLYHCCEFVHFSS